MLVLIPIIGPPLATVTAYVGWQIMLASVVAAAVKVPVAKDPIILPLMLIGSGLFALAF
jgi:hypothetical protein